MKYYPTEDFHDHYNKPNQPQQQYNQAQYQHKEDPKPVGIKKGKSFEIDEGFEIIKQGYGITEIMKKDIINLYSHSNTQNEYKNPADYMKHQLDIKYGQFWFVFMWEDVHHQSAQYSYYNNDDRVLEFKMNGWHILIYSFNQVKEVIPPNKPLDPNMNHAQRYMPPPHTNPHPRQPYYDHPQSSQHLDPRFPHPSFQDPYRPQWYQ